MKNKTNRGDKARVDEISKRRTITNYNYYAKRLYKSFGGVQSRSGEIGKRASLINWLVDHNLAGSNFPTKIPSPAHKPQGVDDK